MTYAERRTGAAVASQGLREYVHIETGRVDWVDYLKGFCILLVVMLHSVEGVEKALGQIGWMHIFVEVSQPLRMPAFFLAAGLFFMRNVDRPLDRFIDGKVLHFAYFYVLWLTIQFAFKAPGMASEGGPMAPLENYLLAFVQPFGTLWFIYILPVFFAVTRLVRRIAPEKILAVAIVLQIMPIHTGSMIIDPFASYFVWFFVGYAYSDQIFRLAEAARNQPVFYFAATVIILAVTWWAATWSLPWTTELLWPVTDTTQITVSMLPFVSLALGVAGIVALVSTSVLLANLRLAEFIRWCGAHSIIIYLAFFLPMAFTRVALLHLGIITDVGTISLLVWIAAIVGPVVLFWLVQRTGFGVFLFERPGWARLERVRQ
ncbi:MAG: acyltransferase family protein [Pseudomonadota bacterium]